jgi:pimeloyl-ACP methyl ester carboxylesterase
VGILGDQGPAAALDVMQQFLFVPADDPDEKARIVAEVASAPQHVAAAAMDAITRFDGRTALEGCRVPALVIWAGDPPPDFADMKTLCPTLEQAKTFGAGHFHQLFVPDQVNAMIARFVEVSVPALAV